MPLLELVQRVAWLRRVSTIISLVLWYGGRGHKCRSRRPIADKRVDAR